MTADSPDNEPRSERSNRLGGCCPSGVNALDEQFGESYFRSELRSYKKGGLGERARLLVDFLQTQDVKGRSLLEIGCGTGALHMELLTKGAERAIGIDASSAAIQASNALAKEMGLTDRTEYRQGDFIELQEELAQVDIVLLDRVVCCYPNMETLMGGAARHAQGFVGITMPRRARWTKWGFRVINLAQWFLRRPFRVYYHDPEAIDAVVIGQGFTRVYRTPAGIWETVVFQRNS